MAETPENGRGLVTPTITFDIIQSIYDLDGATLTELANHLGRSKSTLHRHLATMEQRRYVVNEEGQYHLSLRFSAFGEKARSRKREYAMAEPIVEELARETSERTQFLVEEHEMVTFVHVEAGERAVEIDTGVGIHLPLYATGSGKAFLAHVSEEKADKLIENLEFESFTEHTITDVETLRQDLEEVRERGYGINDQERVKGVRAVAVPVRDRNDRVFAALSIAGPTHRMKRRRIENELSDLLLGAANELELKITYD